MLEYTAHGLRDYDEHKSSRCLLGDHSWSVEARAQLFKHHEYYEHTGTDARVCWPEPFPQRDNTLGTNRLLNAIDHTTILRPPFFLIHDLNDEDDTIVMDVGTRDQAGRGGISQRVLIFRRMTMDKYSGQWS